MKKIVLVTNIPAPYRVDLFHYMQMNLSDYEIYVVYTNKNEDNRQWTVDSKKMLNSIILESKVLKITGRIDNRYIHLPASIGKTLSQLRPDVVVAWEYNPAALQCLAWCKVHKVPMIHLTDGTLNSEKNIGFVQKMSRMIITNGAVACIASSTKAKEKLQAYGVDKNRIFLSLLTVSSKQFHKEEVKRVAGRILYVGSMVKRKGLDLLIASLASVKNNWQLHIVGNGTEQDINGLRLLADKENILDRIVWCGYKDGTDLIREYEEASVFVLPTREDCFGLVLLEALFAGTPIVASKYADGAYDIVREEINGLIADPFDSDDFAKAIDTVLEHKEYLDNALQMDTSCFAFENVAKGYCSAIEYVASKR